MKTSILRSLLFSSMTSRMLSMCSQKALKNADPAYPTPKGKEKVKERVKSFLSNVAVTAIEGMDPEERARIGKEVVNEERQEISYDRRQSRETRWMALGILIGIGIGVPVTFSAVWSIFVFPLWLELYQLSILIPVCLGVWGNRDGDIWDKQLKKIGGYDTLFEAMRDYGAVGKTQAQLTGRLPSAVWKQCPTCEHNRQKLRKVGVTINPEHTFVEVKMYPNGTTEPTECPKCGTMVGSWTRPNPILEMATEALMHGA